MLQWHLHINCPRHCTMVFTPVWVPSYFQPNLSNDRPKLFHTNGDTVHPGYHKPLRMLSVHAPFHGPLTTLRLLIFTFRCGQGWTLLSRAESSMSICMPLSKLPSTPASATQKWPLVVFHSGVSIDTTRIARNWEGGA